MLENLPIKLEYLVCRKTWERWKIDPRTISNHELVFIIEGEGETTIAGRRYPLKRGDLLYFHPGIEHSMAVTEAPYMVFYGVHFTLPENLQQLDLPHVQHIDAVRRIELLFHALIEENTHKKYLYAWRQNILLEQILCEIFTFRCNETSPIKRQRIEKAIHYIHDNCNRTFSLEELLAQVPIKKSLFLETFKQITGTSPMQYALRLRLEHARDILLAEDLSIAQLAERCGFQDSFYFSRCFKNAFGLSPSQYRSVHGCE